MKHFAYALTFCLLCRGRVARQTPFFEGKTIRIVVGLPASDFYDNYAPLLATYMGNYIPDNPCLARRSKEEAAKD